MDRFVVREPRTSAEYPQENQMMPFPGNAVGGNMIPETVYLNGPLTTEFPNAQNTMSAHHNTTVQNNMNAQYNMNVQHNMNAHHGMMNAQPNYPQRNLNAQITPQQRVIQQNIGAQNTQHNLTMYHGMEFSSQMAQNFGQKHVSGQSPVASGIDPRYLAGFRDNSAQYIVAGQQIQRNASPITRSFGSDYQSRTFSAIDRNKQKNFAPHANIAERSRVDAMLKSPQMVTHSNNQEGSQKHLGPQPKKTNELDLFKSDAQNQIMSRTDKLKALNKSGPRAFSGPVEKVLKWHKSLQDIGVLIIYEVVATCISVRPGESSSKILLIRDDSGPAMQVIYYEIDFLLPELHPPCTVRVVGRMLGGTCRLHAFRVRPATGDDVSTLPRRAAVSAHHVAKLCKEYGNTTNP